MGPAFIVLEMTPQPALVYPPMDRPRFKRGWWGWTKLALKFAGALFIAGLVAAFVNQAIFDHGVVQAHPAPGRLVDIGGRRLHLIEKGHGPTVVFECGSGGCSLDWAVIQDSLSGMARTVSYDRAGNCWSDPATDARTPLQVADDLHALLHRAQIPPPYLLVGYSLGGVYVQVFARRYPNEVSGLVLVDSSHPDQFRRLAGMFPDLKNLLLIGAPFGVQRLMTGGGKPSGFAEETWAARNAITGRSAHVRAVVREVTGLADVSPDPNWMQPFPLPYPLVVLTHSKPIPLRSREKAARLEHEWTAMQQELASYSPRGRQIIVPNSSHGLPFEHPEVVVDAVQSVMRDEN